MFQIVTFDVHGDESNVTATTFEGFLKRLLSAAGYNQISLRPKRRGLEYDVTGLHGLTGHTLVGEAKGWNRRIPLEELTSFVGKMVPIWNEKPDTFGVFLSLSDLSVNARDYYDQLGQKKLSVYDRGAILALTDKIGFVSEEALRQRCRSEFQLQLSEVTYLVTDRGDFVVGLLMRLDETLPTAYAVFRSTGELITEPAFLELVRTRIPDLEILAPYSPGRNLEPQKRPSLGFVLSGSGWFDYRYPTAPANFIGRDSQLEKLSAILGDVTSKTQANRVIQVLSRSGVGKSSLLLKFQEMLGLQGVINIACDARNLRNEIDVIALFQELLLKLEFANKDLPCTIPEVHLTLRTLSKHTTRTCILIDQFETLFTRPRLFDVMLDLIAAAIFEGNHLVFVIARKNDQPTTFDAVSQVDVARLREMSESVFIDDFKRDEAMMLADRVKEVLGRDLPAKMKGQVLEFSGGFPWLHKRTLAHVIGLLRQGVRGDEILAGGLRPEELFEEEVAALDEVEKDVLRRLATRLPATFDDLGSEFGDGETLARHLKILQDQRLVRLTGRTYDIYNDFFKEWLRTGQPPIEFRYMYRITPAATLRAFKVIHDGRIGTLADTMTSLRKSEGSALNLLRELRLLGLLKYLKGAISVPDEVKVAAEGGTLGDVVQRGVLRNRLVQWMLGKLTLTRGLSLNEVAELLKQRFPFVEAGSSTWKLYARNLISWMDEVRLVHYRGDYVYPRVEQTSPDFMDMIRKEPFLPSSSFRTASSALQRLYGKTGGPRTDTSFEKGLADLRSLGLVEGAGSHTRVTPAGREIAVQGPSGFLDFLRDHLAAQDYVRAFLSRLRFESRNRQKNVFLETLQQFGDYQWNHVTLEWRFKVFTNWLVKAGLARRLRGHLEDQKTRQTRLVWDE